MSSKDTDEGRVIHSKSGNIETTIDPIQDGGRQEGLPPSLKSATRILQ